MRNFKEEAQQVKELLENLNEAAPEVMPQLEGLVEKYGHLIVHLVKSVLKDQDLAREKAEADTVYILRMTANLCDEFSRDELVTLIAAGLRR